MADYTFTRTTTILEDRAIGLAYKAAVLEQARLGQPPHADVQAFLESRFDHEFWHWFAAQYVGDVNAKISEATKADLSKLEAVAASAGVELPDPEKPIDVLGEATL